MSPSKARANEVKRTPTTNGIFLFKSPATWNENIRTVTKAQRKKPELTLISEVGIGTNIQNKFAFCNVGLNINRNRSLGRSPRSQNAGVATIPNSELSKFKPSLLFRK